MKLQKSVYYCAVAESIYEYPQYPALSSYYSGAVRAEKISYSLGYTPDMAFALKRRHIGKKVKQVPVIRYKNEPQIDALKAKQEAAKP